MNHLRKFASTLDKRDAPIFACVLLNATFIRKYPQGEQWLIVLKVLFTLALFAFIAIKGNRERRAWSMQLGLIFCSTGDALLQTDFLLLGLFAFGLAHIFLNAAFGRQPAKWIIGLCLYIPLAIVVILVHKYVRKIPYVSAIIYLLLVIIILVSTVAPSKLPKQFPIVLCAALLSLFILSNVLIIILLFLLLLLPEDTLQFCPVCECAEFCEETTETVEQQSIEDTKAELLND